MLSKVDINFVSSILIVLSGNYFNDLNLVLFLTEESLWSILRYENGIVIPLMTELDEPFRGVDGYFNHL